MAIRRIKEPQRRCCPQCGDYGFSRTGYDFFNTPVFECHTCHHEWKSERGPMKGTGLHRVSQETYHD